MRVVPRPGTGGGAGKHGELRGLDLAPPARSSQLRSISSGPGRLTQAMAITRAAHNGMALTSARSELFLTDDGLASERIVTTPRINVTKAADRPLRYLMPVTLSSPERGFL